MIDIRRSPRASKLSLAHLHSLYHSLIHDDSPIIKLYTENVVVFTMRNLPYDGIFVKNYTKSNEKLETLTYDWKCLHVVFYLKQISNRLKVT